MDPMPRRGRLRRWAGLLSALVSRGGAWVRRAAAAMRSRLAHRATVLVKRGGLRRAEEEGDARTAAGAGDHKSLPSAVQGRGQPRPPSTTRFREEEDHGHGDARGSGNSLVTGSPSAAQEDRGKSKTPGGEASRDAAPETTRDESGNQEDLPRLPLHRGEGMDAAAAPSADLLAPGGSWGAERTKIGDRSIVAPSPPVKLEMDAAVDVTVDAPPVVSETVLVQRDVAASAPAGGRWGAERTKIGGDRSIVAPSLVKQEIDAAAESSDRGEEKDDTATATPGAVPVAHERCSGGEDDQTVAVPEKDPQDELDAPPVVSDAVLVQPDLAAPSAPAYLCIKKKR